MAYTKYSLTPANNNATPPDGAPEGMLPSAVNDTMRDMMAQIRDVGDGIRDGTYTMTAPKITGGTITGAAFTGNTFTNPVISGGSINNTPIGASTANTGAFTTLSASGVATFSAGTVSAPAITTTGDTNTGIFFPAADTIAFTEGGVEAMRIDSSGNVAISTTAPILNGVLTVAQKASTGSGSTTLTLDHYNANNKFIQFGWYGTNIGSISQSSGTFINIDSPLLGFSTGGSERMRIDSSGNVGIGTSSPTTRLTIAGGSANITDGTLTIRRSVYPVVELQQTGSTGVGQFAMNGDTLEIRQIQNFPMAIYTNNTERMRINSTGDLLLGTTSAGGERFAVYNNSTSQVTAIVTNRVSSGLATDVFQIQTVNAAGTGFMLARYYANGVPQVAFRGDGTIFAQNTTVQSISDLRTKENIKDYSNGLDIINSIRPVRFDFKEGFGNNKKNQLGFVAQEIEQVFPEAVDVWGESDDPEKPYKSVGTTALIPVLVKAIQEQQAIINDLQTRITQLENK